MQTKIKSANTTNCKKCLQLSFPVDKMIRFARLVNPDYNIYKRTGLKEGMPIPNQTAADRIVRDMVEDGYYVDFVEALVQIGTKGYMGLKYTLLGLDNIIEGLVNEGYTFDKVSGQFFENQRERITPNWGRLQEGDERKMALLRLDIVGYSRLVKNNPDNKLKRAYEDVRRIVERSVTNRFGRLWSWEGDGALAAFIFGPKEEMAVYAGMEILHELFFYNRLRNPLDSPINMRLGAHTGDVCYSNNELKRLKNETVIQAMAIEAMAGSNTLGVSFKLYMNMDAATLNLFGEEKSGGGGKYRLYAAGLEK